MFTLDSPLFERNANDPAYPYEQRTLDLLQDLKQRHEAGTLDMVALTSAMDDDEAETSARMEALDDPVTREHVWANLQARLNTRLAFLLNASLGISLDEEDSDE